MVLAFLSDYYLNLCGKYLALAILALGMDLIWGYTGILSLGQAVFFGLGAYAMGMYLMLGSSGQGVYGEPSPTSWCGTVCSSCRCSGSPSSIFPWLRCRPSRCRRWPPVSLGWLTFRRRVSGTYFAILTQAMAYATWLLCNRNEMNLGGTNGLTDFKSVSWASRSMTPAYVARTLSGDSAGTGRAVLCSAAGSWARKWGWC